MIEWLTSRKNQPIAKIDGQFVCSSVDPVREADSWFEENKDNLEGLSSVFVLGIGCGYHLAKLSKEFSGRIIAIDANKNSKAMFSKIFPLESQSLRILLGSQANQLLENEYVIKAVKSCYGVISFGSVTQKNAVFYSEVERKLLGRDAKNLQLLLEKRGWSELFENPENSLQIVKDSPLSILELNLKEGASPEMYNALEIAKELLV